MTSETVPALSCDPWYLPDGWDFVENPAMTEGVAESQGVGLDDILVRSPDGEVTSYLEAARAGEWPVFED